MPSDARKCPAKAEAIRQKDICAALAEGFVEIAVAIENIAEECFRRRDVDIAVFIGAAGHVPAPLRHIFLQLFEFLRIVFLHQLITVASFKAEAVVRVLLKELKIFP